eukprot:CAMPEP_0205943426 /NCGR_PEP_ID=MMETSP1325-20131115/60448_1 /ASSEMBLY_ACC=CAM_ASM_000708 /TAXON_ID=236786 /ORGANISM="Florenciella sp., Strain RCC1007" /LENGTH=216 /DNA_ID=CAMNT_0053314235 /DNA_START=17 /DNA_END=663 /DNA_ORIENTATION=-
MTSYFKHSTASWAPRDKQKLETMKGLIDQATSDILNTVDWGANMQMVDEVNSTDNSDVLSEAVRLVRKRIQHKNPRVVMTSLTLTETLVKNCHTAFHKQVATKKFMDSMGAVARNFGSKSGRDDLEVADKALELIQAWGEAFMPMRQQLPLFFETWDALRREGFRFPETGAGAPVLSPAPVIPNDVGVPAGVVSTGPNNGDAHLAAAMAAVSMDAA